MSRTRVAIVGVGKRVLEAVLPAFNVLENIFEVRSVHGRSARKIEAAGRSWQVDPLAELNDLADVDLIYLAVGKDSVPDVLRHLVALHPGETDLLIDTPVLRFRHFRHVDLLSRFRRVGVPEDCAWLPWMGPVRESLRAGTIGELEELVLWRSGYAYHALATAKVLLGAARVTRGRRVAAENALTERRLVLSGGKRAVVVNPRDYATGWIQVIGSRGSICDQPREGSGALLLEAQVRGGLCRSLQVGDHVDRLDEAEASLTAGDPEQASVIARQAAMKRVGLVRLLRDVQSGGVGYPVDMALEDMVVDYHLERLGRYRSTALTRPDAPLARWLLKTLSRLGG